MLGALLHSLAEAHLIGEDAGHLLLVQPMQPRQTDPLVRQQRAASAERGGLGRHAARCVVVGVHRGERREIVADGLGHVAAPAEHALDRLRLLILLLIIVIIIVIVVII